MFLFGNKIERLKKFIIKALEKAVKAGNSIISLYNNAGTEIEKLKFIIGKLQTILDEVRSDE